MNREAEIAAAQPAVRIDPSAVLALFMVQFLFGVHYSVAKEILEVIPPPVWVVIRCVGASAVLGFLVVVLKRPLPKKSDLPILLVLSLLGVAVNQILFIEGLSRSFTVHSVLIMATIPLQTLVLSVLLGQERSTLLKFVSVLLGTVGIFLLFELDQIFASDPSDLLLDSEGNQTAWLGSVLSGDLMMLFNSSAFSLFLVLSKKPSGRLDSLALTTSTFAIGTIAVIIYGIRDFIAHDFSSIDLRIGLLGAFAILGPTVSTYLLNFFAIRRVSPSMVGFFIYFQFLFATSIGIFILGEPFSERLVAATICILVALGVRFAGQRRP